MTRPHARIAALRVALLLAVCAAANTGLRASDPVPPAPVAPLVLRDGRVLHNARVISDEGDSVVFHADEGLIKIAKSNLPQVVAEAYPAKPAAPATPEMVMEAFDPNPPNAVQEPDARPKPKPAPRAVPPPGADPSKPMVFKGCTLVSFEPKSFQSALGSAEVVIRNDTDSAVVIFPGNLVCVTTAGARLAGRAIVSDAFPPIVKRREYVPADGQVDDFVIFTNDTLDIASVQWAR
jgi:hypothetical protein